jgi:hypothetical protein
MSVIVCYILVVILGLPLVWAITARIGSKAEATPIVHAVRIVLRCSALALALAPTAVVGGYTAFPLPASLAIAVGVFFPKWLPTVGATPDSIRLGVKSLILCWLLFLTVSGTAFLIRQVNQRVARAATEHGGVPNKSLAPVGWLAAVSGSLLVIFVFFLIWLSSASPKPGNLGP